MWDWIGRLNELRRHNQLAVLVTVTKSTGSTPRKHGAKMIVLPDGTFFGTIGGGPVELYALDEARRCFEELQSRSADFALKPSEKVPACGGTMELYMELVNDNPTLYLFGAGHVGQALCKVLDGTPFTVHLIDERDEWINAPSLPAGVVRHAVDWSGFIESASWCDRRTFVTIASFSGELDQEILAAVLPHQARFIGMVGSKSKWAKIQNTLAGRGLDLSRVRCPIGHPNGGDSPQEIAISIANQLVAVYHGKE